MNELFFESWRLPAELELMLKLCLQQPVGCLRNDLDWDYFDALVQQHRVQPLLIRGLRRIPREQTADVPKLDAYRARQNEFAMRSMKQLQILAAVNSAFAEAGVRMIAMKGPMLSMELYGDPSMRSSRDLDLMVALEDLPRAGEILKGMGYTLEQNPYATTLLRHRYYHIIEHEKHEVYYRDDVCLELHWQSDYQREQSFDELWQRREEQVLMGRSIALMGRSDRYPALFIHAAEHGFLRLRWLLDLYELQRKPGFSWERVFGEMTAQGVGELLLETMLVMYRLGLPELPDVQTGKFSLFREENGVRLTTADDLRDQTGKAKALSDAVYPLLLREVGPNEREWKAYDRHLPTAIYGKTALQWFLLALGPTKYEFELIDLPDWLFWMYFIIRPVNWLRRKLFGGNA